jgi:hypothetical protein
MKPACWIGILAVLEASSGTSSSGGRDGLTLPSVSSSEPSSGQWSTLTCEVRQAAEPWVD